MRTLLTILAFTCITAYAQQYSIGIFAEPNWQVPTLLKSDYQATDSINAIMSKDLGIAAGISIGIHSDRVNSFYIKPQFRQGGFLLTRENLQLFDLVHPKIGEIRDQSQAATKIAYFHHRFRYVGLEFNYQRDITPTTRNLPINFSIGGGLGVNYLIQQELLLQTEGFAMKGEFKHHFEDSLFFQARTLMLNASIFGEMNYEASPGLETYAQIKFLGNLMASTTNEPRVYIWSPALNVGLRKFF
ncbi:hypothetical protein GYB22_00050 [bacterium]|nr:hypothetical protein [bacterium]